MFEKIMSGLISISMMLFSSYEGNNASFASLRANLFENNMVVSAKLENAFENDFEEIFKLGIEIDIFFRLKITSQNNQIFHSVFSHKVEYDPLLKRYFVNLEEQDKQAIASTYDELIEMISQFEFDFKETIPQRVTVELSAYLEKLFLPNLEKEYDLMMLWKMKNPVITSNFRRGIQ
jgi:hypothetical protein